MDDFMLWLRSNHIRKRNELPMGTLHLISICKYKNKRWSNILWHFLLFCMCAYALELTLNSIFCYHQTYVRCETHFSLHHFREMRCQTFSRRSLFVGGTFFSAPHFSSGALFLPTPLFVTDTKFSCTQFSQCAHETWKVTPQNTKSCSQITKNWPQIA